MTKEEVIKTLSEMKGAVNGYSWSEALEYAIDELKGLQQFDEIVNETAGCESGACEIHYD